MGNAPYFYFVWGGAGATLGGAPPHPRRGPAHRRQHRQVAGSWCSALTLTSSSTLPTRFSAPTGVLTCAMNSRRSRPSVNIVEDPLTADELFYVYP